MLQVIAHRANHRPKMGDKMSRESGFSLVEMMIVTAIVGILASVAIPAYINYVNRANQGDAVNILMSAKMDQESFYENNFPHRYAETISCLPSCNTTPACLVLLANGNIDCTACAVTFQTGKKYVIRVVAADTQNFHLRAERRFYTYRGTDMVDMNATANQPIVVTPDAIGFSLFKMLFD
jgi:prepilin-type N-terminal cleavage/methylation domain-containing protein